MNDFNQLYNLYAKDIFRFALYLCGNRADAEDITSETFTRAILAKKKLNTVTVKGYLLTIARNIFLEDKRRKKNDVPLNDDLLDTHLLPDEQLTMQEDVETVYAFLKTVPEIDRSALIMRTEGLSYHEIANMLGLSISATRVKIHRLRVKLIQIKSKSKQPTI